MKQIFNYLINLLNIMLGMKSKSKTNSSASRSTSTNGLMNGMEKGSTTVIAKGTKIEGQFNCTQNVRLDGIILGEVKCDSRLVMGETGRIEGKIKTQDADIRGTIEGEIHVSGLLHLQSTARVNGTITAGDMKVEQGASYTGKCSVGKSNSASSSKQTKSEPIGNRASAGAR